MKKAIAVLALLALSVRLSAQDAVSLVEEAPFVSAVLGKVLENCPSFSSPVELTAFEKANPAPSTAVGAVEYQKGSFRWEVKLTDLKSPQLSESARAVVRQLNGDRFLALTRRDQRANYLVLAGCQAYLEQPLPAIKLEPGKARPSTETVDGRVCSKEQFNAVQSDGRPHQVLIWRSKELKGVPIQMQIEDSTQVARVRFKQVRLQTFATERFALPGDLAKYNSVEDLVQSVLISRVKRRMGLD